MKKGILVGSRLRRVPMRVSNVGLEKLEFDLEGVEGNVKLVVFVELQMNYVLSV